MCEALTALTAFKGSSAHSKAFFCRTHHIPYTPFDPLAIHNDRLCTLFSIEDPLLIDKGVGETGEGCEKGLGGLVRARMGENSLCKPLHALTHSPSVSTAQQQELTLHLLRTASWGMTRTG